METSANAHLTTVKYVEKATAPAAPWAVPSVPKVVSVKEAQASAAAATEMHQSYWK